MEHPTPIDISSSYEKVISWFLPPLSSVSRPDEECDGLAGNGQCNDEVNTEVSMRVVERAASRHLRQHAKIVK